MPPAGGSRQDLVDSDENRLARWRLTLDFAWRHKMDEVIALSKACCGLTSDHDGNPAGRGVRVSSRLESRTERAFDELVAIEDAIARIDDGTYGMCASCRQAMPDEWLTGNPAVRYCPVCLLRRTSRREPDLPGTSRSARPRRALPKRGSGVRRLG